MKIPVFSSKKSEIHQKVSDGKAIPIVSYNENNQLVLDKKQLESVLLQDEIKDCYVMVVAVAGIFRKGKSFLLNFMLSYLNFVNDTNSNSWLDSEHEKLSGFESKYGVKLVTEGISIWSKIFRIPVDGKEVAIILMDTQGTFDNKNTSSNCQKVFALATLFSSYFIYNVPNNIQTDFLQNLQIFVEYSKIAQRESQHSPGGYQTLLFLIRDFSWSSEYDFGLEGGQSYLSKEIFDEKKDSEKNLLRDNLRLIYSEINCYLMPHPGFKVLDKDFDGQLSDIEEKFKEHVKKFVPTLFSPEKIVRKQINGTEVKVKDLVKYFEQYFNALTESEKLAPESVYMANAKASNLLATQAAMEVYQDLMMKGCQSSYLNEKYFNKIHECSLEKALDHFKCHIKYGGESLSERFRQELEEKCKKGKLKFREMNNQRLPWYRKTCTYVKGFFVGATGGAIAAYMAAEITTMSTTTIVLLGAATGVGLLLVVGGCVVAYKSKGTLKKHFTGSGKHAEEFSKKKKKKLTKPKIFSYGEDKFVSTNKHIQAEDQFKLCAGKFIEKETQKLEDRTSYEFQDNLEVEFKGSGFRHVYKLLF